MKLFIPVILGTTRTGRQSEMAARFIVEAANSKLKLPEDIELEVSLIDPLEFSMPLDGNDDEVRDPRYSEIAARADGFVVVVPEYNHGIPGSLKRLLDSESGAYRHKPFAFAGVSAGSFAGVRAVEQLVLTVRGLSGVVSGVDIHFPSVQNLFDESKVMKPEHQERYTKHTQKLFNELLWLAQLLKWGRENLKQ
jgi:NAD(P)H-dependent FMN reductase